MRTLGIVQARMGSERLPGKVLRPLAGRTVLERVVRSARESGAVEEIVVATTTDAVDDDVVTEAGRLGVPVFRGSVDDVLSRFLGALAEHPAEEVMRFTADCPLLDPDIIATAARVFHAVPGTDYLNTSLNRTLPRGLDVEIIRADTLRALDTMAETYHRTHVTSYVYSHPEKFRVLGLALPPNRAHLRLTLDTPADLELMEAIVAHFGDGTIALPKLAEWLDAHPGIAALNQHIEQKALNQG
ncbi:cytidylyltransferase domain-containing protein [Hamadaea tsunoensis]|uniref:cytidylyltransferase domain-containing protein n=1 Tax=Hamadaea tsunoensis TaxID=53368 RepID=UPI0003F6B237|nr:glycosyltransferase family protein [Hamadaea tsunoensis]